MPDLGPGALGGLTVPDESITCTWTTNLALATDAVRRGALCAAGCQSIDVDARRQHHPAHDEGDHHGRWVVNAAGLAPTSSTAPSVMTGSR